VIEVQVFAILVAIGSFILPVLLLLRATECRSLRRLPFFYSYITYILLLALANLTLQIFLPRDRATVFWFGFVFWQIVEFAVLVEISNHVFRPYPAIRRLGLVLCGVICALFAVAYILPALEQDATSATVLLDLMKRACLTKAAIVLILLGTARYYKLVISQSVKGILIGFILYLGVNIANFELAMAYGRELYANIFGHVGPLAWILGALVWVTVLWNYEPDLVPPLGLGGKGLRTAPVAEAELARYNDTLTKLLLK
jgi:hypothetical protein